MPNRPWYYVPGNNQLSEKRLVLKLDREANKQIQNEKLMDYYKYELIFRNNKLEF